MGAYIKGMEMPENCALCPVWDAGNCLVASEAIICEYTKRPSDCPLVPVPPHVDLIDRDALYKEFERSGWFKNADRDIDEDVLLDAPTVIGAEEGET